VRSSFIELRCPMNEKTRHSLRKSVPQYRLCCLSIPDGNGDSNISCYDVAPFNTPMLTFIGRAVRRSECQCTVDLENVKIQTSVRSFMRRNILPSKRPIIRCPNSIYEYKTLAIIRPRSDVANNGKNTIAWKTLLAPIASNQSSHSSSS
jgi:hypothetical protein